MGSASIRLGHIATCVRSILLAFLPEFVPEQPS